MRSFGHLSATPGESLGLQRAGDGDADRERESRQEPGALLEPPAERKQQAAADDGGPDASAPAAPRRLPFGGERDAVDVAAPDAAHQLARGRVDLVDDFERDRRGDAAAGIDRGERGLDRLRVEKIGRLEQPVAAALDPLHREARGLGVLQHLRNAGAGQPDLGGELLAGVKVTIGKLAQQRESERSEHL